MEEHGPTSIAVVTDPMTEKLCLPILAPHLPPGTQFLRLGQHGEKIKSIEHAHAMWDSLDGMGMDRHGLVIALGGGTITDLTAFVASTYLRGVSCWLVPTTLLAMVDAAIGGKTGINFHGIKNRIGTFHNPEGISIHAGFLDTLGAREMANGWAEHIKHLLLSSEAPLPFGAGDPLHAVFTDGPDTADLESAILESIRFKMGIVDRDQRETAGIRQWLNFGHTAGHALESWAMEQGLDLHHGEAVGWGMRIAFAISERHEACPSAREGSFSTAATLIQTLIPLPIAPPGAEVLWPLMQTDKKNSAGQVNMVLLNGPGKPVYPAQVTEQAFGEALQVLQAN